MAVGTVGDCARTGAAICGGCTNIYEEYVNVQGLVTVRIEETYQNGAFRHTVEMCYMDSEGHSVRRVNIDMDRYSIDVRNGGLE